QIPKPLTQNATTFTTLCRSISDSTLSILSRARTGCSSFLSFFILHFSFFFLLTVLAYILLFVLCKSFTHSFVFAVMYRLQIFLEKIKKYFSCYCIFVWCFIFELKHYTVTIFYNRRKRTVTLNMKRHNAPDKAFILVFSHFIVVFSIEHISVQSMLRMSTHIMGCVCHLKTKYPFEVTTD